MDAGTGRRRKKVAGRTDGDRVAEGLIPAGDVSDAPPHEEHEGAAPAHEDAPRRPSGTSGWDVITSEVRGIDVRATYQRLYDELVLGDGANTYGAILHALDRADRNIVDAERLVRAAKLEQERVDRDVAIELEVLRTTARKELEAEKAAGTRSKAPTLDDIADRMTANWPSKMAAVKAPSEEIHAVRAVCEKLEVAWRSRSQSLRSMADRYAARRDPLDVRIPTGA